MKCRRSGTDDQQRPRGSSPDTPAVLRGLQGRPRHEDGGCRALQLPCFGVRDLHTTQQERSRSTHHEVLCIDEGILDVLSRSSFLMTAKRCRSRLFKSVHAFETERASCIACIDNAVILYAPKPGTNFRCK